MGTAKPGPTDELLLTYRGEPAADTPAWRTATKTAALGLMLVGIAPMLPFAFGTLFFVVRAGRTSAGTFTLMHLAMLLPWLIGGVLAAWLPGESHSRRWICLRVAVVLTTALYVMDYMFWPVLTSLATRYETLPWIIAAALADTLRDSAMVLPAVIALIGARRIGAKVLWWLIAGLGVLALMLVIFMAALQINYGLAAWSPPGSKYANSWAWLMRSAQVLRTLLGIFVLTIGARLWIARRTQL